MIRSQILVISFLAFIGVIPVILLVASLTKTKFKTARVKTIEFIKDWGDFAPPHLNTFLKSTMGFSASFAGFFLLAMTFNWLGDLSLQTISKQFNHFGKEATIWADDHNSDWKNLKRHMRKNWVKIDPNADLTQDDQWEVFKDKNGKRPVRFSRTLVFFSTMVILASLFDLKSREFRSRGFIFLIMGLILFIIFCAIWADRKANFVETLKLSNAKLSEHIEDKITKIENKLTKDVSERTHKFSAKKGEIVTFITQIPDDNDDSLYYDLQILGAGAECSRERWLGSSGEKPGNNALKFKPDGTSDKYQLKVSKNLSGSGNPTGPYKILIINAKGPGRINKTCWEVND